MLNRRSFAKTAFSLFTGTALGNRLVEPEPTKLFPFDFGVVINGRRCQVHPDSFTVDFVRMVVNITIAYDVNVKGTLTHAYLSGLDEVKLHEYELTPGDVLHCTLIFDLATKKFCTNTIGPRYGNH